MAGRITRAVGSTVAGPGTVVVRIVAYLNFFPIGDAIVVGISIEYADAKKLMIASDRKTSR